MTAPLALGKPILPKEHGAWMVLITPLLAGTFSFPPNGGAGWLEFALLTVSVMFGFMASAPLRILFKPGTGSGYARPATWLGIYGTIAGACFLYLALGMDRPGLFWFVIPASALGSTYIWSGMARIQRTLVMELIGIMGLATSGLAASYVRLGSAGIEAVALYLLLVLWFIDRMMFARKTLESNRAGVRFDSVGERARHFRFEIIVHIVSLALAAVVIGMTGPAAPWTAFVPFLLGLTRNVYDIASLKVVEDPMKVGFAEMRLGFGFCALMIAAWRI